MKSRSTIIARACLIVESVGNHDYTMTQALVMLVALIFMFTNFIVDLFYAWLDPRIRYS